MYNRDVFAADTFLWMAMIVGVYLKDRRILKNFWKYYCVVSFTQTSERLHPAGPSTQQCEDGEQGLQRFIIIQ